MVKTKVLREITRVCRGGRLVLVDARTDEKCRQKRENVGLKEGDKQLEHTEERAAHDADARDGGPQTERVRSSC